MAIATSTTRMLTTCLLLLYLCLFTGLSSCSSSTSAAGMAEGSKQGIMVDPNDDLPLYYKDGYQELKNKVKVMMKTRKLLMMDVKDYDETGANPRHDPRKGRGRNP